MTAPLAIVGATIAIEKDTSYFMSPEKVQMSAKDMKEKNGFIKIDDDKFVDQNGKEFNIEKDAKVYNNEGIPQFKDVKKGVVRKDFLK